MPYGFAISGDHPSREKPMPHHDPHDLTSARKVLVDMRHNSAKAIAAGYKRGDTEDAIKGLIEVQRAIEVIDQAIDELDDADEGDEEEDEED
jgi:hypothetical protein